MALESEVAVLTMWLAGTPPSSTGPRRRRLKGRIGKESGKKKESDVDVVVLLSGGL